MLPKVSSAGALDPSLVALDPTERAFVLGATVLGLGPEGAAALVPPAGERCGAALKMLARVPRAEKAARIAQLARELSAAYPPAVDVVHATWLRKPLAAEPTDFLSALVAGGPPGLRQAAGEVIRSRSAEGETPVPVTLTPELAAELRRVVFGSLRHVFLKASGPVGSLLELADDDLLTEVRRLGARSLGASLATSPPEVLARAMAVVGGVYASDLRKAAASDVAHRRECEADVKAAAGDPAVTADDRLERIGFETLKRLARSESPEVKRALALRLPRSWGKQLVAEGGAEPPPAARPSRRS